jgi:hypothetical protein
MSVCCALLRGADAVRQCFEAGAAPFAASDAMASFTSV